MVVACASSGSQTSPNVTSVDCETGGDGAVVSDDDVVDVESVDGADGGAVAGSVVGGDEPTRMSGGGSAGTGGDGVTAGLCRDREPAGDCAAVDLTAVGCFGAAVVGDDDGDRGGTRGSGIAGMGPPTAGTTIRAAFVPPAPWLPSVT
jgi:hypothetical protein